LAVRDEEALYLDGEHVATEVRHYEDGRRFWTPQLPYQDFSSLTELGEALIDQKPR
jgi:hypothetical protein